MALPRRHGEHVGTDRARDPGGEFLRPEGGLEQNEITGRETPFRRRVGMHLDPAVPRDFRNRIRSLVKHRDLPSDKRLLLLIAILEKARGKFLGFIRCPDHDLLFDLFRGVARPLRDDLNVVIRDVRVGFDR